MAALLLAGCTAGCLDLLFGDKCNGPADCFETQVCDDGFCASQYNAYCDSKPPNTTRDAAVPIPLDGTLDGTYCSGAQYYWRVTGNSDVTARFRLEVHFLRSYSDDLNFELGVFLDNGDFVQIAQCAAANSDEVCRGQLSSGVTPAGDVFVRTMANELFATYMEFELRVVREALDGG